MAAPLVTKPKTRTTRSMSALDKAKSDAAAVAQISKSTIDLTDANILETYIKIRDDEDETTFMVLGYRGSKAKLELYASGPGGFQEIVSHIPEEPVYAYFRITFGDSGRAKFIFLYVHSTVLVSPTRTYVPDSLSGLKKAAVMNHKASVDKFFKFYQLTWPILDRGELKSEVLEKMLLNAGGANYSVQEENKGDFSSYKTATKEFYEETEKKGDQIKIVYHEGPLTETPVDISGRSMVAAQSELKKNIKDLDINK